MTSSRSSSDPGGYNRPVVITPTPLANERSVAPAASATASSCRHPSERELFPARDYITGEAFLVCACAACGLARTSPQPAADELDRFYPAGYYGRDARYGSATAALISFIHSRRAARLHAIVGRSGRVLDVGCGQGLLLDGLRRKGWQAVGVERTATAATFARERLALDVRIGDWRQCDLPPASFDAVVLWHVLEHLGTPAELLRWASTRLKPGGALLVGVPNFASPEARWSQSAWFHLDVPRHLTHFTTASLVPLLEDAGFEIAMRSGFSPEYDLFSFVQSVLNGTGLKPNLLYQVLRRPDARMFDTAAASRWHLLASVTLALPVAAVGVVWTALAGWLGGGATLTFYCRKRSESGAETCC
jgi:SAM-dependent methyltransferase